MPESSFNWKTNFMIRSVIKAVDSTKDVTKEDSPHYLCCSLINIIYSNHISLNINIIKPLPDCH